MNFAAFLDPERLLLGGANRFNLAIKRLLLHVGFDDVRIIDGAGDGGADVLGVLGGVLWTFQCKWTSGKTIGKAAVDEVDRARVRYGAERAVVVTNAFPDGGAVARAEQLKDIGLPVDFWTRKHLAGLAGEVGDRIPSRFEPRLYQSAAIERIELDLQARRRALLVLATGLGKTVVGGEVIRRHLEKHPSDDVLVVAAMKDLVEQLEQAMWRHLPKNVPTQVLHGESKPASLRGVTFATVESALRAVREGYGPHVIMVDETHHLSEVGSFNSLLQESEKALQFGVTATPWRGDGYDVSAHFGAPSFKMGIAEGMAKGFLAQVDYKVFVDNIDWSVVKDQSAGGYTLKELNSKLFLPQRDEAVLELLRDAWTNTVEPRAILFCKTIAHAEEMRGLLSRYTPEWHNAACLHTEMGKREKEVALSYFRTGRIPILTAVDILNEGVDVPDVNILGFLRVTHSRRIFVQQLGRGLRLKEGKERVKVLDFVTDLRRLAAITTLRSEVRTASEAEHLTLAGQSNIAFSDAHVGTLMEAWLRDAANLETAMDDAKLQFPDPAGFPE